MEKKEDLEGRTDKTPKPVARRIGSNQVVYGQKYSNGVVSGDVYEEGQKPEDGPIGKYRNVPWSQHD